jgi:hypothetical protein
VYPGQVIGYRKDGRVIFAIAGGAPESGDDTPPDGAGDDDGSDDSTDDDSDEEDEDDDKDSKSKKDKDEEEEVVPKWKLDKAHKRMSAADKRASELQKQLDELKANADVPAEVKKELESVKQQVAAKDDQIRKVTGERDKLSVKLAATTIKGAPDWEDIDTALNLADLSEVEVDDETGKVDMRALKSALTALAKEKPFLVKKVKTADATQGGGASASPMNGQRKGRKGSGPDRSALESRFPALRQG